MNVIYLVSTGLVSALLLITIIYCRSTRQAGLGEIQSTLLRIMACGFIVGTSAIASGFSLAYERFWIYPVVLGLAIWVLVFISYSLGQMDDIDE